MTLSLRERRRLATARDIQMATLELAARSGLENVTTEEIATKAGVSTRTFFNYFPNKEAAAIGAPPAFREDDMAMLCDGSGPLMQDIRLFLARHMDVLTEDEPIMKLVGGVLRSNEKARGILQGFDTQKRRDLTECLCRRVNDRETAAALAGFVVDSILRAIILWEHEDGLSLKDAMEVVWEGVERASRLLARDPAR